MLILTIDTSCSQMGVSLNEDNIILAEETINNKKTHSVKLMPAVDNVLTASNKVIDDVDLFAVVNGPGSFTGLRIGVSTAKAFAYTLDKPVIGVNTLDYLARSAANYKGLICPIIDARNDFVFFSLYRGNERIYDYQVDKVEWLFSLLEDFDEEVMFTGDGVLVHRETLKLKLGEKYKENAYPLLLGKPSFIADIAREKYESGQVDSDIEVYYMRKSQAERMKEEKAGKACK